MSSDGKNSFDDLIYDEEEEFEKLIPKVKRLVMVRKDGRPIIICDGALSQAEQIACMYIGHFFAHLMGLSEKASAKNNDIVEELGISPNALTARLTELKKAKRITQVGRGEHVISTIRLENYLDNLIKKIEGAS